MNLDAETIQLLTSFRGSAIFFGAFFFGETVVITASFLAAHGLWSLRDVFWLALAGTVLSDLVWFIFGQRFLRFFRRWEKYREKGAQLLAALEKITGRRPFLALLFIKFLYGTRILTILYLSMRKISLRTFAFFDSLGTVFWLAAVMAIGWLAGKSVINLVPVLNRFEYAALILLLLIISFRMGTLWLGRKISKR